MNNWHKKSLKDAPIEIIDGDRGLNYPKKSEFADKGYCLFLNTSNVTDNGFNFSSVNFISKEKDNLLRKGKLKRGDIVLTTRGTVGNIALFDEKIKYNNIRINSGMVILRLNQNQMNPYYLLSFLKSDLFKKQTISHGSGSAQPQLPINSLNNIVFPWNTLEVQNSIGKIRFILDSKIELNNKINVKLEAMAKLIYDYWFVQFDFPDANGKPYKSSGGEMVYNDELKRELPVGWEVKELSELADRIGDGIHGTPKYIDRSEYSFINGNNLKNGFIYTDYETKKISLEEYKKYFIKLNENTILLSINGTLGNLAVYTDEKVMLGKSSAYVNCKPKHRSFCYQFFKQDHIQKLFWKIATGSTIKNLSLDSLKKLKVTYPSIDVINNFYSFIKPIDDKRVNISKNNQKLEELRDWLLPMLMNGQVCVG